MESRASLGFSVNGNDFSAGYKFGIGGNTGQGLSNTGSVGAGGTVQAKPTFNIQKPAFSLSRLPFFGNGGVKQTNSKDGNGNWQNIKEYFKLFANTNTKRK